MRRLALLIAIAAPALASASEPLALSRETIGEALARTAAESRAAQALVTSLEAQEKKATGEVARLKVERQRAAAEITLAEVQIVEADLALSAARGAVAAREASLAKRRAPLAGLLAGLATMGRRPPVLALADGTSIAELVRVRALIDGSMPVIARRSAMLRSEIDEGRKLAANADRARQSLADSRAVLIERRREFAALEVAASARALTLRADAAGVEDQVLAGGETLLDLRGAATAAAVARAAARALARQPLAPPRPFAPEGKAVPAPLAYRLPTIAPVIEGLGEVSRTGVRSRGLRFATARGAAIVAPAAGTILFASAFRNYDGIVVIDHGAGWTSLLTDVAATVKRGDRVAAGAPLGRALGDVGLELRSAGQPRSASLIAGSSTLLSNGAETR